MDGTTREDAADGMGLAGALAPLARSGGGLRPVAKRIFKGYFVLSDAAARARESLTDVYAEAKHEHYSPAPSAAAASRTQMLIEGASAPEPMREGLSGAESSVAAGRLSRRGIRLLGSVLSRVG